MHGYTINNIYFIMRAACFTLSDLISYHYICKNSHGNDEWGRGMHPDIFALHLHKEHTIQCKKAWLYRKLISHQISCQGWFTIIILGGQSIRIFQASNSKLDHIKLTMMMEIWTVESKISWQFWQNVIIMSAVVCYLTINLLIQMLTKSVVKATVETNYFRLSYTIL